jgi:hypothetical protein
MIFGKKYIHHLATLPDIRHQYLSSFSFLPLTFLFQVCGTHVSSVTKNGPNIAQNWLLPIYCGPGLPDGFFLNQNHNLGKFWRAIDWKMLIYFMDIWNILHTFGIFYNHLVHFVFIWYIFPVSVSFTKINLATLLWTLFRQKQDKTRIQN